MTTAALVFPLVLLLHYFLRFDLSIIYFVVMLCMAVLFLGKFKIRKPGRLLLGLMVGFGTLELLTFLLIRLLGKH